MARLPRRELKPEEQLELLKIVLQESYADARERANSSERIGENLVRGMLLLNGAAIATILTILGLGRENPDVARDLLELKRAAGAFVLGVAFSAAAAAAFTISVDIRSRHELEAGEDILRQYVPQLTSPAGNQGLWKKAQGWLWGTISLLFAGFLCFTIGSALAFSGVSGQLPDGGSMQGDLKSPVPRCEPAPRTVGRARACESAPLSGGVEPG